MVCLKNRVSRKVTSAAATIRWKTYFAVESIAEYEFESISVNEFSVLFLRNVFSLVQKF
jgi:hypothetical protein